MNIWWATCLLSVGQLAAAGTGEAVLDASSRDTLPDTLVVCPASWRAAMQPWIDLRRQQGYRLAFFEHWNTPEDIRDAIRRQWSEGGLRWVVLVGDAPSRGETDEPEADTSRLPVHYAPATVISRWGTDREIPTDNWYADLDDDGRPELAIGRLTADSADDLRRIVQKIVRYEQQRGDNDDWRQRINLVAGVGQFGTLIDGAIEMTTRRFLTEQIPPAYTTTMTYGSWRSPFCPDPRRFHEAAVARLNEGCWFWVYLGHGHPLGLDRVHVPGGAFHIFDVEDVPKLQCENGNPIALFLACYTSAFDARRDCLAEELLRQPGGPVAIVGGSRMTMPYAMAVMGNSMLYECFHQRRSTLGELLMYTKRSMLEEPQDANDPRTASRRLLDGLASLLMPGANAESMRAERREHTLLFHLVGDPLLTLRHPREVEVHVDGEARAGEPVAVRIRSPHTGGCRLELLCRRDRGKRPYVGRQRFEATEETLQSLQDAYLATLDNCWTKSFLMVGGEELTTQVVIPSDAYGPCVLRAAIGGDEGPALGACEVFVQAASR